MESFKMENVSKIHSRDFFLEDSNCFKDFFLQEFSESYIKQMFYEHYPKTYSMQVYYENYHQELFKILQSYSFEESESLENFQLNLLYDVYHSPPDIYNDMEEEPIDDPDLQEKVQKVISFWIAHIFKHHNKKPFHFSSPEHHILSSPIILHFSLLEIPSF